MCWGFGWLAILDKCPNWAGILPTFLHIFLAIISAMELMLRPYISCHSPGGTGDSRAFYGTALSNFLQDIPCGFYIVADKDRKENDVFNFYLPQLRIKRQACGLLLNKWRIFKKPKKLNLTWIPSLIECCFRLHNFCINEREKKCFFCEMI
jgi:hypothetical protein